MTQAKRPGPAARLAAAVLASALVLLAARAVPALEAVRLENVRWQALPDEVMAVYRGPDGRVWYQARKPTSGEDVRTAKASIEAEFVKPSPVLVGARPALFEPGGRVWFITEWGMGVLGYDGKTWIQGPLEDNLIYIGQCPGHRQPRMYGGCNLWADGKAVFPVQLGVVWYDGKDWSHQAWPYVEGKGLFE